MRGSRPRRFPWLCLKWSRARSLDIELKGLPIPNDVRPKLTITIIIEREGGGRIVARIVPVGPVENR